MLEVHPVGYRVLAEFKEYRGAHNIIVPELMKDNGKQGKWVVIELGQPKIMPAGQTVPIPVKVGDAIAFNPSKATSFTPESYYGGRRLLVIECEAIISVIDGEVDPVPDIRPATGKEKLLLTH